MNTNTINPITDLLGQTGMTPCRAEFASCLAYGENWRNSFEAAGYRARGSSFWLYKFDEWANEVDELHRWLTSTPDQDRIDLRDYLRDELGTQCPDPVLLAHSMRADCAWAARVAADYVRGPWTAEDIANVATGLPPTDMSEAATNCICSVMHQVDCAHRRLTEQIDVWRRLDSAPLFDVPPGLLAAANSAKLTLRGVAALLRADMQRLRENVEHYRGVGHFIH